MLGGAAPDRLWRPQGPPGRGALLPASLGLIGVLLAFGLGCVLPESLDDACPKRVLGTADGLEAIAEEIMLDIQCHRRFVGLPAGRVTSAARLAADSHATYLDLNGVFISGADDLYSEDPGLRGFTGEDLEARFEAAGALGLDTQYATWELVIPDVTVGLKELFTSPYLRDPLFQPGWLGVGISTVPNPATDSMAAYLNVLYAMPSGRMINTPLVYPRDGQTDVPLSFVPSTDQSDPLADVGTVGFPITVTVGSLEGDADVNPYVLTILSASLVDLDDERPVELITLEPSIYAGVVVRSTAIFAPAEPLTTDHSYEFEAELEWNMGKRKVRTAFRTGTAQEARP